MKFNRRVRDRMSLVLFLLGNIASVALSGLDNETGLNLDCTNDLEDLMSCHFDAQNCTEYNLTLRSNDGYGEQRCIIKQCDTGRCCCSVKMMLIPGETHTATVFKGGQSVESKLISITDSAKPKAPTIISVNESNGNFKVEWTANTDKNSLRSRLSAQVTYHKKGDTKEVSKNITTAVVDGPNYHEILGKDLEPSTTYLVSVKSYTSISGLFSDSSEEHEFRTPASHKVLLLAVIISLSIVAVIISSAIYRCYLKLKAKWWDPVSDRQIKVLLVHPSEQEVLKPMPSIISSISVEPYVPDDSKPWSKGSLTDSSGSPQPSSGISTGSSSLSYANTEPADIIAGVQDALCKAFANISPISSVTTNPLTESNKDSGLFSTPYHTCGVKADDLSSGSSGFDNKTYSILIPGCACQTVMDNSENQTQAEMFCDSTYHPSEGDMMTCLDKQAPACLVPAQQNIILPAVVSSLMPTDMSYQCNVDSGRFSYAEDSSLSSVSSGTNTTMSCDRASRVENFDEVLIGATKPDGVTVCDENPCYKCVPASFPPVDDDYQAFETLVKQPDILFSEQRSGEEEEDLDKYPEKSPTEISKSFLSSVFPDVTNDVQDGQCLSELQKPFISLISAVQSRPIITDSGYQSV
ncbi:uncharacterized protein LOC122974229 isoform X3 [Thunnus albacares]|uniref:uncharacterized protein LOC122974229 isoform X3 n=1 Tax=Thunnus albacares TaxID=8236 RepID=UPI001CF69894|nr:uncharacterized protein LOC122974229 isoform X3 [Thunnus albacares]